MIFLIKNEKIFQPAMLVYQSGKRQRMALGGISVVHRLTIDGSGILMAIIS